MEKFNFEKIEMANVRIPEITEKINNKFVYFGDDNLYPDYLLDLFYKSSKNSAILTTIGDMIKGNNFIKEGKSNKLLQFFDNQYNNETLYDILPKISLDLAIYGAYCLNVRWSRDGKSIANIKYVDVKKVRFEKNDNDELDYFYISNDWSKHRRTENTPVRIQGFSEKYKKEKNQLLYVKKYQPGLEYYALPHYLPSVLWAELDYEIANFHLQSCLNGYYPGLIINFTTGIPTKEEQKIAKKDMDKRFKGTNNANNVILTFSEGKDQGVLVTPIESNASDKKFKLLEETITKNILIANKATSSELFGVQVASKLGNAELMEAYEMYQLTFINSFQKIIINSFQKLAKINGITDEIEIERYKIFEEIIEQKNNE